MLPKRSSLVLLLSTAVGLLTVHACIALGGALREVAVAFCAFSLLIAAPIAILAWFGSLTDQSEKSRRRSDQLKRQRSDALLWQRTLRELQAGTRSEPLEPTLARAADLADSAPTSHLTLSRIVWAPKGQSGHGEGRGRPILALFVSLVAAGLGLAGCSPPVPLETWSMVQPGMATPQLVALMGAPDQIKSNGTTELWQYCRDFLGRNAKYYMAVLIDGEEVRELRPYQVLSDAGCEDFYHVGF